MSSDPDTLPRPNGSKYYPEFVRFYKCIKIYEKIAEHPCFPPWEIWKRSLLEGPSFAETYKDFWRCAVRNQLGDDDPWITTENLLPLARSYNDLFPVEFLFHWREESSDIYDFMLSDPPEIDLALLEEFRQEARALIREKQGVYLRDFSEKIKLSKALEGYESVHLHTAKLEHYGERATRLRAKRTLIQVHPAGARDSGLLDAPSLNLMLQIEDIMLLIISDLPGSIFKAYQHDATAWIHNKFRKHRDAYKYMKDFSKCGLTCPQELIRILLEEVNEAFELHLPEDFYKVLLIDDS